MKPYPNYKDSGIEWIGKVPKHWKVRKLSYQFSVNTGFTPSTSNNEYYENGTNDWITISDLNEKYVSESSTKLTDLAVEGKEIIPKGSLLYSFKLSVGKMAFAKKNIYTNEAIFAIYPDKNINLNYYYYLLGSILIHNSNKNIYGANILNQELIRASKLVVPKSEEQTQIANYLDHKTALIDKLIAKKEQLIQLLEEEKTAVINQAVTKGLDPTVKMKDSGIDWLGKIPEHWDNHRIDWIAKLIRGNTGLKKDELLNEGEYVALQYGKTYKVNEVNDTFNYYVNSEYYKQNQVVNYGDTIFISTSETIEDLGHSCYYNRKDLGLIGGEQILLKPDNRFIFNKYLFYYSKNIGKVLQKYAKGLKVLRFKIDDLKKISIPLPPIEEQKKIVNYIDYEMSRIRNLKKLYKKEIKLLREYKTTLISEVVTGKVDVREKV
ncbi:restriction endonuclease subunit S [Mesonia sp. K7]|uniref:restriction endonuclease subunit S n=1 Tax=Mesonia sp. K7 TaxID=2218606 RepID=UPI000DA9B171|nr:restriction endonuclease subunit S [Mesonia sp. K7]PZD79655.1 restriction endonuclease subunit S [Mesonia sp. K7]